MKTFKILTVLCIFLFSATFTNAQDSTIYRAKLEKYKTKRHNGRIMTIAGIGGIAIASGFGLASNSAGNTADQYLKEGNDDKANEYRKKSNNLNVASTIFTVAGLALIIPGSINWSIGKKKVKEYQLRLDDAKSGFYFSPNQVGLKLTFKF